jgi:hypothetical protein
MVQTSKALAGIDKYLKPISPSPADVERFHREHGPGNPLLWAPIDAKKLSKEKPENCSQAAWDGVINAALRTTNGINTFISSVWTFAGLFADGPKVYCPTLEEFEALARVEIRVPLNIYRQPFPTVVVMVPDGVFGEVSKEFGTPAFTVLRSFVGEKYGGIIAGRVIGTNNSRLELDYRIAWYDEGESHIESHLKSIEERSQNFSPLPDCYKLAEGEDSAVEKTKRAAINACLLLSQHAPRLLCPANPQYEAKLKERLKNKNLAPRVQAENAHALKMMPMIYGFHQRIRVVEREDEPDEINPTGSCPPKTPHWRRGHWRNQTCGEKGRDRKLVFIPSVLVNEYLLAGSRSDTRVTMTTK